MGTGIAGAYVGGFASLAGDIKTPEIEAYAASADAAWDTLAGAPPATSPARRRQALAFGFAYGYYTAGTALIQALNAVDGDLSDNHAALQRGAVDLDVGGPFGDVTLDENRQASSTRPCSSWSSKAMKWSTRPSPSSRASTRRSAARFSETRPARTRRPSLRSDATCRGWVTRFPSSTAFRRDHRTAPTGTQMSPNDTSPRTEPQDTPLLNLESVSVAFGGLLALDGIDLDVAQGERLAILGPNGAGKTTLFNVVAGDIRPTSGSVLIRGVDSTLLPSRLRPSLGVARTYQRPGSSAGLTVEDNLYLA